MTGKYIILEGGEGVGKTTQGELLVAKLSGRGINAVQIREPGGDRSAEALRAILLGDLELAPQTSVLLFNAARVQTLTRIRSLLSQNIWAIADRGSLSTIAYQSYGEGADLDFTREICNQVTKICQPDMQLVLTGTAERLNERRQRRGTLDRFERMGQDFHTRVNQGYAIEAKRAGIPLIDANGNIAEVTQLIWGYLEPLVTK